MYTFATQIMVANIILSSGKDQSLRRFHPWVFSGAIKKIKNQDGVEVTPNEGDVVNVFDNKAEFLGKGHYSNGSIAVRILSFVDEPIDAAFWQKKIADAYQRRTISGLTNNPHTNVYRLVHAEGDGLPGLILDFYNGTVVFQAHSIGMHMVRKEIAAALQHVYGQALHTIYDKSSETLPKTYIVENEFLLGNSEYAEVLENGNTFKVNWITGQKTGFFIDQRDNRQLLASFCKGKSLLNTFCYSGGFSVYAMNVGATLVHSTDSSKKAIELTDENMKLNHRDTCTYASFAEDTFSFIEKNDLNYDVVILDPPAFAKHHNVKHNAVQGYKRLNAETMRKMKSGSVLFTFSCSQAVDRHLFNSTIMSASIQAGRKVRVLYHLAQPADHAPSIFHPEGEYLKGLVLLIE
jgi:23S rRNA (cytosine1962-C5)-methyltransferase